MFLVFASTKGNAIARRWVVRFAAFLFAVLAAFSQSSGSAHAHAAMVGEAYAAAEHIAAGRGHAEHRHATPCNDDRDANHDGVCVYAACGACAPIPSAGIAFPPQEMPAAAEPVSVSFPSDPPTLERPPKHTVTA